MNYSESSKSRLTRKIGVLLHPSALPRSPVCGSFGEPLREWIKSLALNGIGIWQFLPLAPCDETGSPYSSPSGFAFNTFFLDANDLQKDGFLPSSLVEELPGAQETNVSTVDFNLAQQRSEKLDSEKAILLDIINHLSTFKIKIYYCCNRW